MKSNNQLILALLNVSLFFIAIAASYYLNFGLSPFSLKAHPAIEMFFLAMVFFVLSAAYSGLISPIIFLYYGLISAGILKTNPSGIALTVFPLLIVSYAGSLTGHYSGLDLAEKENMFSHKKQLLALFFAGIILAIITGFLFAFLAGIDQSKWVPFLYQN